MKAKYFILGLCLFIIQHNIMVAQQQVSIDEIKKVAVQSLKFAPNSKKLSFSEVNVKKINTLKNKNGNTLMYETVLDDGQGVLFSGSKACLPILGYFNLPEGKSIFDDDVPCGLKSLLEEYQEQIDLCFQNDTIRLYHKNEWLELQEETDISQKKNAAKRAQTTNPTNIIVAPLTTSRWGQSGCQQYNYYTPSGCDGCNKLAGCVAVAMAQIMYYWKYPVYTVLEGTAYDWCNMVDKLNENNNLNYENERNAVARLIKDCADAVDMNYGCAGDDSGSGADALDARDAFVDHFNYSDEADAQRRIWHQDSWKDRIKGNLHQGRPVLYRGRELGGFLGLEVVAGHAFVCDGYADGDYFHFNWGWNGSYSNTWFTLDDLNPGGTAYNSQQAAVFYIHPRENQNYCNYNLPLLDHYSNAFQLLMAYSYLGASIPESVFDEILQNPPKYSTVLTSAYPATIDNFTVPTSWYTISSGTTREYVAHEAIILKPGFHAEAGSNFTARIEPCRNCGTAQNAPAYAKSDVTTAKDLAFVQQYLAENPIEESEKSIKVFPNPTTGKVYVLANAEKVTRIEVKNIQGATVLSSENLPQSEILLDISTQPAGMYLISVQTGGGVQTFKIVKN